MDEAQDVILEGWKQIAAHVGVSQPTARRRSLLGVEARMPVYFSRLLNRVIAKVAELDRWKRDQILPVGVGPVRAFRSRSSVSTRRRNTRKNKRRSA